MAIKKRPDRRTRRTQSNLTHAMVDLVAQRSFDDFTVQELIDRADVGRSTFYSHFRGKEDLFRTSWEGFIRLLADKIDWQKAGKNSFMPVTFLFDHLKDVQPFYRGLVRSGKTDALFRTGIDQLSEKIAAALQARAKGLITIPIPILSNYLASELFMLLQWWLDERMPYPPQRMDEIYHRLVNPTIASALRPLQTPSVSS
jgi:AcrR family transcriptional regulator